MAGAGHAGVLFAQVLPNVLPTMLVMMTTTAGWMMLETAGLSFLGLGAQPPAADLGSLLGDGRQFMTLAPQLAALPGLVILVLVIAINLFGDGLRDRLDPRLASAAGGSAARTPIAVPPAQAPPTEQAGHAPARGDRRRPEMASTRGLSSRSGRRT